MKMPVNFEAERVFAERLIKKDGMQSSTTGKKPGRGRGGATWDRDKSSLQANEATLSNLRGGYARCLYDIKGLGEQKN